MLHTAVMQVDFGKRRETMKDWKKNDISEHPVDENGHAVGDLDQIQIMTTNLFVKPHWHKSQERHEKYDLPSK